jgi:hypothetical protein
VGLLAGLSVDMLDLSRQGCSDICLWSHSKEFFTLSLKPFGSLLWQIVANAAPDGRSGVSSGEHGAR